jgi:hypothetical protein
MPFALALRPSHPGRATGWGGELPRGAAGPGDGSGNYVPVLLRLVVFEIPRFIEAESRLLARLPRLRPADTAGRSVCLGPRLRSVSPSRLHSPRSQPRPGSGAIRGAAAKGGEGTAQLPSTWLRPRGHRNDLANKGFPWGHEAEAKLLNQEAVSQGGKPHPFTGGGGWPRVCRPHLLGDSRAWRLDAAKGWVSHHAEGPRGAPTGCPRPGGDLAAARKHERGRVAASVEPPRSQEPHAGP